jgi:hypothetical protein
VKIMQPLLLPEVDFQDTIFSHYSSFLSTISLEKSPSSQPKAALASDLICAWHLDIASL